VRTICVGEKVNTLPIRAEADHTACLPSGEIWRHHRPQRYALLSKPGLFTRVPLRPAHPVFGDAHCPTDLAPPARHPLRSLPCGQIIDFPRLGLFSPRSAGRMFSIGSSNSTSDEVSWVAGSHVAAAGLGCPFRLLEICASELGRFEERSGLSPCSAVLCRVYFFLQSLRQISRF